MKDDRREPKFARELFNNKFGSVAVDFVAFSEWFRFGAQKIMRRNMKVRVFNRGSWGRGGHKYYWEITFKLFKNVFNGYSGGLSLYTSEIK
jgi:hypothetical protein